MSYGTNPYAPTTGGQLPVGNLRLADVGKRFLGFLIDALVGFVVLIPGYALAIISGITSGNDNPGVMGVLGMLWIFIASLGVLAAQIYLLATRSQTIGKYMMKTQIVDVNTGRRSDFVHCFLLRMLVNGLICGIPCIGLIYFIVDSCYVFRADHRCIHDLMASTCVVDIS